MEIERSRRVHHTGIKGFYANRLVIRVILAIEVALAILFAVALGLTLHNEPALFTSVMLFGFHFGAMAVGLSMLEAVHEEHGIRKRNRHRRFGWFLIVLVVLITDVYSSIEFLIHNAGHLAGYHYLTIFTFIAGGVVDVFYLSLIAVFRK
jgi:hypothetical protein